MHDWLLTPEFGDNLSAAMTRVEAARTGEIAQAEAERTDSNPGFWPEEGSMMARYRPYRVVDGTLIVPVQGVLLDKFPYTFGMFATGYEYIEAAVARGLEDESVQRIAFDVSSPGGLVSGCFDCADAIHAAGQVKPTHAFADEHAYSAAYALASSAGKITVARTGGVGSIGVVAAHLDMSKMLDAAGLKITYIYAGKHKVEGRPEIPLSDEARARWQERIDHTYEIFVSTVARNRGMDAEAVRATEADTFHAPEAVERGLADAVGSFDEALAAFAAQPETKQESQMTTENMVEKTAHEQAVATATTEGRAAGATAERARVSAILGSEEAKSHPAAARHLALNSDMSAEDASSFLAALPAETTAEGSKDSEGTTPGQSKFEAAMSGTENPNLGAGDPAGGEAPKQSRSARAIAAAYGS